MNDALKNFGAEAVLRALPEHLRKAIHGLNILQMAMRRAMFKVVLDIATYAKGLHMASLTKKVLSTLSLLWTGFNSCLTHKPSIFSALCGKT